MQDHPVIQLIVNPTVHHALDVTKVEHHAAVVERRRFERNDHAAVVPMQVLALAIVIEQAMAVTKVDLTSDAKHEKIFD